MQYRDIAATLRSRIRSGEFASSRRLPTERALSDEFGVTRVTVRRALRVLEEERLVRRIQGSGTYANPVSRRRIPLMIDYTGSMAVHAPRLNRSLVSHSILACDETVAAALGRKPGIPLVRVQRIDYVETTPIAWDEGLIPEEFARGLERHDWEDVAFIEAWADAGGFRISWCRQEIEAVAASPECSELLRLKPGSPVLKSTEVYYGEKDLAFGLFFSYYHPDHICICSRYDWTSFGLPASPVEEDSRIGRLTRTTKHGRQP
jgi:GntR family transcriptional regulator